MSVRLEHIGIAVRSLDDAAGAYSVLLSVDDADLSYEENEAEGVLADVIETIMGYFK